MELKSIHQLILDAQTIHRESICQMAALYHEFAALRKIKLDLKQNLNPNGGFKLCPQPRRRNMPRSLNDRTRFTIISN